MSTPPHLQQVEAWWAFATRVLAFLLGGSILTYEMLGDGRLYLIVAGVGLMGPVVAQSVATVFASIRTGSGE